MVIAVEVEQANLGLSILAHNFLSSDTFVPLSYMVPRLSSVWDDLVVFVSRHIDAEGQYVLVDVLLEGMVQPLKLLIVARVISLVVFIFHE